MKYRILMLAGHGPVGSPGSSLDEYRAQCSRFGLLWTDLEKIDYGHYQSEMVPRTYLTREQAQTVIDKDIRQRSSPPPATQRRKWVKL